LVHWQGQHLNALYFQSETKNKNAAPVHWQGQQEGASLQCCCLLAIGLPIDHRARCMMLMHRPLNVPEITT